MDFPTASPSLGSPSLAFGATSGNVMATVAPSTNPASASNTPFVIEGATLLDIKVTGNEGPVEVCVDGAGDASLWHFVGGRWVDVTTRHSGGRVCGTVTSFSPFAVAPAKPKVIWFTAMDRPKLDARADRLVCRTPRFVYSINGQATAGVVSYVYRLSGPAGKLAMKRSTTKSVSFMGAAIKGRWVRCTVTATQAGTTKTSLPSAVVRLRGART